jgi:DNA-binding response OmpR family regulator
MKSSGAASVAIRELAVPTDRRPPPLTDEEPSGAAEDADGSTRILVVEDDFLIASQMEDALSEAGFDVVLASSAEEALAIVAAGRPELVVMDVRLSGAMDGVDAALELFRTYGLRSIFSTAHSDPVVRARAAPAQPLGWLIKPYSMPALVAAARGALRRRGPRDA